VGNGESGLRVTKHALPALRTDIVRPHRLTADRQAEDRRQSRSWEMCSDADRVFPDRHLRDLNRVSASAVPGYGDAALRGRGVTNVRLRPPPSNRGARRM
jgi:hypothetical protein